MKRVWRGLAWFALIAALLVVGLLAYATANGGLVWFRSIHSVVICEDEKVVGGSLHYSAQIKAFILTPQLNHGAESYWIDLQGNKDGNVASCGEWSAPPLPLFFVSSLRSPCFLPIGEGPGFRPPIAPTDRRLVVSGSSLTFVADNGKRIRSSWE